MTRTPRNFARGLAVVATVLTASAAEASPNFPSLFAEQVPMECEPQCKICHTSNPGRSGTADQVFAQTMVGFGLQPGNDGSVTAALNNLKAAPPDSDEDGYDDLTELLGGSNPSIVGLVDACAPDVRYGCGARVEPRSPVSPWSALATGAFALGAVVLLRRRRRV